MRIVDVDPEMIPPDDDRWEPARPTSWPVVLFAWVIVGAIGLAVVLLIVALEAVV